MNYLFSVFFISLLVFTGCDQRAKQPTMENFSSKTLVGSWQLADLHSTIGTNSQAKDKLLTASNEKEIIRQGQVLSFFPDHTFTEITGPGSYRFGKWKYSDKGKFLLLIDSSHTDTILLGYAVINKVPTLELAYQTQKKELQFSRSAFPLADYHKDPFYSSNNIWRLKPSGSEDTSKLENRLANYFQHMLYILKSTQERQAKIISFEFSQGIVKIYSGGIGIQSPGNIPQSWKGCFFNEKDFQIVLHMFENYLKKSSYKGASTGKWIEDDYNILLGIYGDLRSGKFRN
jgi:hypothetical protein